MLIGYARVSTAERNPTHQLDALRRAGIAPEDVYLDIASGAKSDPLPRPVRAHIHRPGEPITPPKQHLVDRLVDRRAAIPDSACPTCGHEPIEAQTRWQQHQDLATIWLHLDGDTIHEQRRGQTK
ncbi:MAG TPA: recombinase family protein [Pseudonocardiaceae bacterium]|jgi:hypothetical protein|nr:recombinase family protein [Pseudonocardiaceae bacterium]